MLAQCREPALTPLLSGALGRARAFQRQLHQQLAAAQVWSSPRRLVQRGGKDMVSATKCRWREVGILGV